MKYSLVILNITFMLSSVEPQRRLSFRPIILDKPEDNAFRPFLPADGWVNPYNILMDYEWELLCEEQFTAQRIQYFSVHKSEYIHLSFVRIEGNIVFIRINRNPRKIALGVKCLNLEKRTFFLKNNKYDGLLLFTWEKVNRNKLILFQGFITYHLSYEDAGSYAISIFENSGIPVDVKEQQLIRVCASLFQGLSSDLVQNHASYFITEETVIIGEKILLKCTGIVPLENQIFIQYTVILAKWNHVDEIAITHVRGTGERINTKTVSLKYGI